MKDLRDLTDLTVHHAIGCGASPALPVSQSIICILGDIRLWVGDPSTSPFLVSLPQPNLSLSTLDVPLLGVVNTTPDDMTPRATGLQSGIESPFPGH